MKNVDQLNTTTSDMMHAPVGHATSGLSQCVETKLVNTALHDLHFPHFVNPNPGCNKDCRFQQGPSMMTALYYPPIYDKNGVNTNPDGNTAVSTVTCNTCGKQWTSTTQYGETTFKEVVL